MNQLDRQKFREYLDKICTQSEQRGFYIEKFMQNNPAYLDNLLNDIIDNKEKKVITLTKLRIVR